MVNHTPFPEKAPAAEYPPKENQLRIAEVPEPDMESVPFPKLMVAATFFGNASAQLTVIANVLTDAAQGMGIDLTEAQITASINLLNRQMETTENRLQELLVVLHGIIAK